MRLIPKLLLLLNTLPLTRPTTATTALSPWLQIHQTLHTYPLAIDLKQAALFPLVFAPHAVANYTAQLSNLTGLPAITAALTASVANLSSQHALSTVVIDIANSTAANSTTYFTASLFGTGAALGEVVYLYGFYADELARLEAGWRIVKRQLVFLGPIVGNLSLLAG